MMMIIGINIQETEAEIDNVSTEDTHLIEKRYQALSQQHLATLSEAYYARGKQRLKGLRRWAAGRVGQTPEFDRD